MLCWRAAILAGALVWAILRRYDRPIAAAALLLLAHFASYFQVWEHHYSAVIVAGAVLARAASCHGVAAQPAHRPGIAGWILLSLAWLLLPTPGFLLTAQGVPAEWTRLLVPLSKVLPLMLLVMNAAILLRRA